MADNDRLLIEAQLIAQKFQFFMVKGQVNHLYGYIYQNKDASVKYALDITYDDTFPENPPVFSFPQVIPNLPQEIELQTLNNWTTESHVVEAVSELSDVIKKAVEGQVKGNQPKIVQKQPIPPAQPQNANVQKPQLPVEKQPNVGTSQPNVQKKTAELPKNIQQKPIAESPQEEYLTPSMDEYPTDDQTDQLIGDQGQYATAEEFPEWKAEDFEQSESGDSGELDLYSENDVGEQEATSPDVKEEPIKQPVKQPVKQSTKQPAVQPPTQKANAQPQQVKPQVPQQAPSQEPSQADTGEGDQTDIAVSTEAALIQQEYAMDYIGDSIGKVEIYLTITIEQTFIIQIDFSDYPKRPKIELQEGLKSILGNIYNTIDVLKNWNEKKPIHIVKIIRELEGKLWFLSDLEVEAKMITGEYKSALIDGVISHLRVSLVTYGFKEFPIDVDITKYPAQPSIKYSKDIENLIKVPPENLNAYRSWKRKESHAVDLIREISWLVDKNSRIAFEIALLKGGVKDVKYEPATNMIKANLAGQMKTKDAAFAFEVSIPESYPMNAPKIDLKSELEGMEDIKEKLTKQITTFTSKWSPFSYLIDLFNQISKAIFEVSVVSCVICHSHDCPTCKKKISAENIDEQCNTMCPACERLYHKHCWDQTIISFGKCGFCLRPPPPNMRPT
jgi:ubiquitin-protein ligase